MLALIPPKRALWRWSCPSSADASFFEFKESKRSKVRPPCPAKFRQQMVELVLTRRTPAQLSREFGVKPPFITNWVRQATVDEARPTGQGRHDEP